MLGVQIDALTWNEAVERLLGWARARQSRYVAISNVHVVVSASRDSAYRQVIDGADMATPDGAPVARRTAPVVAAVSGDEYAVYSGRSAAVVVWGDGALSGWCML